MIGFRIPNKGAFEKSVEGWLPHIKNEILNTAGLTDQGLMLLMKDFICLSAIDTSLMSRTLRYLCDNEDLGIIPELEVLDIFFKAPNFAPKLKTEETRSMLFKAENGQVDAFLQRLGYVYNALMNPLNPNQLMPQRTNSPSWLEALLLFASSSYNGDLKTYLQLKIVEKLLEEAEKGPDRFVRHVFLEDPTDFSNCPIIKVYFSLAGFNRLALDRSEIIRDALTHKNQQTRFRALRNLSALAFPVMAFLSEIVGCGIMPLKKMRKTAIKLLLESPADETTSALSIVKQKIETCINEEKINALHLYVLLSPEDKSDYLGRLLANEENDKMKKIIFGLISEKAAKTVRSE